MPVWDTACAVAVLLQATSPEMQVRRLSRKGATIPVPMCRLCIAPHVGRRRRWRLMPGGPRRLCATMGQMRFRGKSAWRRALKPGRGGETAQDSPANVHGKKLSFSSIDDLLQSVGKPCSGLASMYYFARAFLFGLVA